ncbi:hypothetical protein L873DRAFT_357720 [Choiromyces venosus 120613-1]|uniref:Uncharacterized protein n=1 Tax=Choiromyces venosus 120613-1 TaxID=1336337 RepID=A0A3N4IXK9_9PEZI|nr:hypothetical protein L873DRAFT_357720 [Choiromyces venosus 120613-1]
MMLRFCVWLISSYTVRESNVRIAPRRTQNILQICISNIAIPPHHSTITTTNQRGSDNHKHSKSHSPHHSTPNVRANKPPPYPQFGRYIPTAALHPPSAFPLAQSVFNIFDTKPRSSTTKLPTIPPLPNRLRNVRGASNSKILSEGVMH